MKCHLIPINTLDHSWFRWILKLCPSQWIMQFHDSGWLRYPPVRTLRQTRPIILPLAWERNFLVNMLMMLSVLRIPCLNWEKRK